MEKTNEELKQIWNAWVEQSNRVLMCYEGDYEGLKIMQIRFKKAQDEFKAAIAEMIDTRKEMRK